MGEERVWQGSSSALVLFGKCLGSLLFFWLPAATLMWAATKGPLAGKLAPDQARLAVGAAAIWFALPFPYLFGKWVSLKCRRYELTSERLRLSVGVLSRRVDEMELYRVKDITIVQPFFLRLVGLGHVVLATSDRSNPTLVLEAVSGPAAVREKIRAHVEMQRDRKRVKEVDME